MTKDLIRSETGVSEKGRVLQQICGSGEEKVPSDGRIKLYCQAPEWGRGNIRPKNPRLCSRCHILPHHLSFPAIMVNITFTIFTSLNTTVTTTSHTQAMTTLLVPTTFVTTVIRTVTTVFVTTTEIGVPTTATLTSLVPTTTIKVENVNLNPIGPLFGLYILASVLLTSLGYLSFRGHTEITGVYFWWHWYLAISAFTWAIGLVATALSKTVVSNNPVIHEFWGVHFNIASDVITVGSALIGLINSFFFDILRGKPHIFGIAVLSFICAGIGLFSSICSLYEIKETEVGKAGGWYIGLLMWLIGLFLFVVNEYIYKNF